VVPMNDASTPPVSSTAVLLSGRPDRSPRSTRPPAVKRCHMTDDSRLQT